VTDCTREIRRIIAAQGPIRVDEFMRIALTDPRFGYYIRRNPISGDFITAPEISQIFGELIGLFFVQLWEDRGRPKRFQLIELGPGRGTLMADMLRAAGIRPQFLDSAIIDLVEVSPVLAEQQSRGLASWPVTWHRDLRDVPADAATFIVANEFFDALPVRQFVHRGGRWHERKIALDRDRFCFVQHPEPAPEELIPTRLHDAPDGAVFECSADARRVAGEIASRIVKTGGAALIVDYGHLRSGFADTFQAVHQHKFADPLAEPGEADLTFHVDFEALAEAAKARTAHVLGPVTQGRFLTALGIRERSEILKRSAPAYAQMIDSGVERLIGDTQMGQLFKMLAITTPDSPPPPGFGQC
jgi:NADH dehydrogenase [ubiquinone] 1 alpha subcomplex assembly factor 7